MIVVNIEIWPANGGPHKRLGSAVIANDGTGSRTRGNYRFTLYGKSKRRLAEGRVGNFPRLSKNVWFLLQRALRAALDE